MRTTHRLWATSSASSGRVASVLKPNPVALLPPIQLYRRILRAHRKHLDPAMRILGDQYIRKEFRDHRLVENPIHIIGFLTEWQLYAQKIEGDLWKDEKLDKMRIDKMSDQQIGQLYELMQAIQKGDNESEGH